MFEWTCFIYGLALWFVSCFILALARRRRRRRRGPKKYKGYIIEHRYQVYESRDAAYDAAKSANKVLLGVDDFEPLEHPPHKEGQNPHFHVYQHRYMIEDDRAINHHFSWKDDSIPPRKSPDSDEETDVETDAESGYESGTESS